ncbi:MAG: PTS transporter subunit IIC [Bacillota bacterium]
MKIIDFLINQVFVEASVFLGLIALIGLLLQRRKFVDVLEGTIKTVIGIIILNAGIGVFLGALIPLTSTLNKVFGVQAIMPDCFGPFGIVMKTLAQQVSLTFVLAFIVHVILVRILPWKGFKNVFLTGHIMLFQSAWFVMAIQYCFKLEGTYLIALSSVLTGILWTVLPAMARPFTKDLNNDEYTLGHLNTLGVVIPAWIGDKIKRTKKCDELELPGFLSIFSDYTVLLAFLMPIIYIIMGLAIGQSTIETLSGGKNWIIWLILSGFSFAAGIAIVLFGVRMFLAAMLPAFKGISQKILPGAIPALDDPVFYPFAPVAAMLGFIADFAVSVLITLILIVVKAPIIIIPGPIFFFFDGAIAGVFGDKKGGWKGAVIGGAVMGIIVQLGSILLVQFQPALAGSGLMFSGPDMVLLAPVFYLFKAIGAAFGIVTP